MEENFVVECNVCKQLYENYVGSTECCGSIAYIVEDGVATKKMSIFASFGGSEIKPTIIDFKK